MTDAAAPDHEPELDWLHQMIRIRRFEERCVELYSRETIRGFLHLYIGEEAVATGVMSCLEERDAVVATYREHGHALACRLSMRSIFAEMFGRVDGCCRGRGGSMHLFSAEARLYGGNAIVGGGLPLSVGLALADKLQGRDVVTACFFGEGAMAEGEFHEAMNLAALWNLPVLFCCENNLYAMGTALDRSESETNLAIKAASYEVPAWSVDGMDVTEVVAAATNATTTIRAGGGPVFIEFRTYRFRAHSMYDPDRYRPREEIERWKERDPIELLAQRMEAAGVDVAAARQKIEQAVGAEIDDAVAFATASPPAPLDELTRWVMSDDSSATATAGTAR